MTSRFNRGSSPGRARDASQLSGSFEAGHKKLGGRKKGTRNLISPEHKMGAARGSSSRRKRRQRQGRCSRLLYLGGEGRPDFVLCGYLEPVAGVGFTRSGGEH